MSSEGVPYIYGFSHEHLKAQGVIFPDWNHTIGWGLADFTAPEVLNMSTESMEDQIDDKASDVWSYGMVVYVSKQPEDLSHIIFILDRSIF